ncbi:hypothetical protein CEG14_14960 [Bordetella genomosp. 1]|uniref:HTH cro/C1-type domain-containing protein n=1 Tax=Bordetella genomosp. 1 TaxID=1395607 RepID=A0A261SFW1_9BORD|nr:LexA family transcriptional regulator [Bordetella genomosp. 1]OZI36309.1 hypothetical protein CEG14_14960 [Bordetella genomosp. 1]
MPLFSDLLSNALMKAVAEIRLENLEHLVSEAGTAERLAERAGLSPVYLSQIRSRAVDRKTGKARNLGTAAARKLEAGMAKPAGWMDTEHARQAEAALGEGHAGRIGFVIQTLRMLRGMTVENLGDAANLSAREIEAIEKDESVPGGSLKLIAAALRLPEGALTDLVGKGFGEIAATLMKGGGLAVGTESDGVAYIGPYQADRMIPVIGTAQLGENGFYEMLEYPAGHGDGYIRYKSKDPNAYVLKVRGDSMKPAIRNGWYIVVEPSGTPTPGEYVVLQLEDGRKMAKELLFHHPRTRDIEVMSVNGEVRMSIPGSALVSVHPICAVVPPSQLIEP